MKTMPPAMWACEHHLMLRVSHVGIAWAVRHKNQMSSLPIATWSKHIYSNWLKGASFFLQYQSASKSPTFHVKNPVGIYFCSRPLGGGDKMALRMKDVDDTPLIRIYKHCIASFPSFNDLMIISTLIADLPTLPFLSILSAHEVEFQHQPPP